MDVEVLSTKESKDKKQEEERLLETYELELTLQTYAKAGSPRGGIEAIRALLLA